MKKGFTILELLVASLLLGMLLSILTMIFSQSSIAWRTGTAVVEDIGDVRESIAGLRDEADNTYIWNEPHRLLSPWRSDGTLRKRAVSTGSESSEKPTVVPRSLNNQTHQRNMNDQNVGSGKGSKGGRNYIINVKSAGPDKEFGTWDDIWSFPDDFE